jgi:hypothetical protein
MSIKDVTLDPEIADLVNAAFDRSWQFVKTDPELADIAMDQKRSQLSRHLTRLAQSGERDLWRLANRAIGGLRREQGDVEPDGREMASVCRKIHNRKLSGKPRHAGEATPGCRP